MHFTLDNSVCRVEKTCPLLRLDNLVVVPNKLMRCILHSTTSPLRRTSCEIYFSTRIMSSVLDVTVITLLMARFSDGILSGPLIVNRYISDHASVCCKLLLEKPVEEKVITHRKYKSIDLEKFNKTNVT